MCLDAGGEFGCPSAREAVAPQSSEPLGSPLFLRPAPPCPEPDKQSQDVLITLSFSPA
ncbi:hypothetical protein GCM10023334_090090 [Nonomuraea thailandensis]